MSDPEIESTDDEGATSDEAFADAQRAAEDAQRQQSARTPPPQESSALAPAEETALAPATLFSALTVAHTFKLAELSFGQLYVLARQLSRAAELVPKEIAGKPDNVFFILCKAAEIGVSAMVGLAEIQIIRGKLVMSSHLISAKILGSGKAKKFRVIESTKEKAVIEVQRHDWTDATNMEFTMAEAKELKLDERGYDERARANNAYRTQPANMLRRRVIARAGREYFGDVIIAYDPDELESTHSEPQAAPPKWGAPSAPITDAEIVADTPPSTGRSPLDAPDEFDRTRSQHDQRSAGDAQREANSRLAEFSTQIRNVQTRAEAQELLERLLGEYMVAETANPNDTIAISVMSKARPLYQAARKRCRS